MMMGFVLALIHLSVGAQTASNSIKFDPYLPGELNEQALMSLADEDLKSAQIYIERAYRLNPLSPDIDENLKFIRDLVESRAKYQISQEEKLIKPLKIDRVSNGGESTPPLWPKK